MFFALGTGRRCSLTLLSRPRRDPLVVKVVVKKCAQRLTSLQRSFSGSCLHAQSCERVANSFKLDLQERSRCRRLELCKTASSACLSFSTGRAQHNLISVSVDAGIGLCTCVTLCYTQPDKGSLATVGEGSGSDRDTRFLEVSAPPHERESEIAFADSRFFPPHPASHSSEAARVVNTVHLTTAAQRKRLAPTVILYPSEKLAGVDSAG